MFAALLLTAALTTKPHPAPVLGTIIAVEQVIKKVDPQITWKPCPKIERCLLGTDPSYEMSISLGTQGKDFYAILFGGQETSVPSALLFGEILRTMTLSCAPKGSYSWVSTQINNWILSSSGKETYASKQIGGDTLVFTGVASDAVINLEIAA